MKKLISIIILSSIILCDEGSNTPTQFRFPLDARQLTLPPLNITQQGRDFTELLGISTTAPVPDGSMYFHADIPDSILNAGPVDAFIFYGNGQDSNWSEEDAYYLGTAGYENTFEAVAQTPSSGDLYIGVQANLTFEGIEVTATQSPYNANDNVPASWYVNACEDETGDEETGGQSLDIQDVSVAVSDNRIHVQLKNAGGGFPTGDFFGPWYLYVVGILNPEDPDSSLYGIAYGDGGFGLLYPGVWKFSLDGDFPEFVADIEYSINGNNLNMAANMDDIFYDSDFGPWPNEFESIIITGLTVAATFDDMAIGDQSDPAFMNPDFQSYEIGVNTPPVLSELTYEIAGDSAGLSLVHLQIQYTDDDNHFPLFPEYSIFQNGNEIFSGDMISYDHSYNDGSLFEILIPLGSGSYDVTAHFFDGMDYDESTTSFDISGGGVEYDVTLISGWNLIGLSVTMDDPSQLSVFPTSIEETLYGFTDSYYLTSAFIPGSGYWLRFDNGDSVTVSGSIINELTVSLMEGWNLIAGPTGEVPINWAYDPDSLIVPSTLFGYDASGYIESDFLAPGYGYWIRSFDDGDISLSIVWNETVSHFSILEKKQIDMNTLSVNGKTLYFGNSILSEKEKLSYSLPPKPPAPSTDIRFSGDTKLCETDECLIEVMNDGQPLVFECKIKDGEVWEIFPVIASEMKRSEAISLFGEEQITFNSEVEQFILRKSTTPQTPTEFALFPAHPNPFNPVTTIRFTVPELSDVKMSIYDIQGRMVETLVNEKQNTGYKSIRWDASGFSSGVYFLHLKSSNFSQMEKLMLIK